MTHGVAEWTEISDWDVCLLNKKVREISEKDVWRGKSIIDGHEQANENDLWMLITVTGDKKRASGEDLGLIHTRHFDTILR